MTEVRGPRSEVSDRGTEDGSPRYRPAMPSSTSIYSYLLVIWNYRLVRRCAGRGYPGRVHPRVHHAGIRCVSTVRAVGADMRHPAMVSDLGLLASASVSPYTSDTVSPANSSK